MRLSTIVLTVCLAASTLHADDETGFVPLFNGKDLSGWTACNIAPETFSVRDGMMVTTGSPVGTIRTEKMYENFIIDFEWRHMKSGGNSGLFIWADGLPSTGSAFSRGIEIQILDPGFNVNGKNEWYSTHGDIFPVNGAELTLAGRISPNGKRSFPIEERTKTSPQWNHYRLVADNGDLSLSVNGKEVTVAKAASPRKGYLMLESEGGEAHFRNVRIKELPSTNPKPEEIANEAEGFVPLFTGLDLRGWKVPEGDNGHWKVVNQVIDYDAQSESPERDKSLWSEREFGDFQLIADWRIKSTPYMNPRVYNVLPDGSEELGPDGEPKPVPQPDSDSGIYLRGMGKYQVNIWCWPVGSGEMYGVRRDASMPAEVRAGVTPQVKADNPVGQWNRFDITVRGSTVKVLLNGKVVLPGVTIPGLPERGPIALQHHGSQKDGEWTSPPSLVQFRNVFVRELDP
jgi:3-keto-disaccharide hydrolase